MSYSPIGESASPLRSFTFNVDPVKHVTKCQAQKVFSSVLRGAVPMRDFKEEARGVPSEQTADPVGQAE
jgi:hypothetical protein